MCFLVGGRKYFAPHKFHSSRSTRRYRFLCAVNERTPKHYEMEIQNVLRVFTLLNDKFLFEHSEIRFFIIKTAAHLLDLAI